MKNKFFKTLTLVGVFGWFILFGLVPTVMLVGVSFLKGDPVKLIDFTFSVSSYEQLMDATFASMLGTSVLMAACTTVLCLLVGYPFAYIVARSNKKKAKTMLVFVMIPFWTNSLIRTYALVAVLKADGVLNAAFMRIGMIETPLKIMYTETAVFIGMVYTLLPFMILPLYAAIEKIDQGHLDAARDLGASKYFTFWKVTMPLTLPGIVSGCMLVFLPALGMFYIPDVLGGARTMLLGNYVRDQFLVSRDLPVGAAASVSMTLLMGLMLVVYYKSVRRAGRKVRI
ncbi:MAG: spermidine/putrescine ABC transporter permease PotB [Desulfovibrio sp.]